MWPLLITISMILVAITQAINKQYGFCLISYMFYSITCVSLLGWMMPYAYELSLTFYKPYFLGIAQLSAFGMIVSKCYFKEIMMWYNWMGIAMVTIGSFLVIKL